MGVLHNHTPQIRTVTAAKFSDVAAADSGAVFIGTYGDYIVKYKNNSFTSLNAANGLLDAHVNSLIWTPRSWIRFASDRSNLLVAGTNSGMYFSDALYNLRKPQLYSDSVSVVHFVNAAAIGYIMSNNTFPVNCQPAYQGFVSIDLEDASAYYYNHFFNENLLKDSINTYLNIISPYRASVISGDRYWGTKKGLYYSTWTCRGNGFKHKLYNIPVYKIVELKYFPFEKFRGSPDQLSYTLIGTENGLYYKYSSTGRSYYDDSLYFVPQTSGYKIYDIDIDTCNSRVWLATDLGIVRLFLNNHYSLDPSFKSLAFPATDQIICSSNPVTLQAIYNPLFTYQWQNKSVDISGAIQSDYTTSVPGIYRAVYNLSYLCNTYSDTTNQIKITLDTNICSISHFADTIHLCDGETTLLQSGCNQSLHSYQWYKNGHAIIPSDAPNYRVSEEGYYNVMVFNCNNYSKKSDSVYVHYTILPKPQPTLTPSTKICEGDTIIISVDIGKYDVKWFHNTSEIVSNRNNEQYKVYSTGDYGITFSQYHCSEKSDPILIERFCPDIFIPNLFTPNNDGKNDVFYIKGLLPKCTLKIYNRYGEAVYANTDYDNNWNGAGLSDGVYYYVFNIDGDSSTRKGWVELIR